MRFEHIDGTPTMKDYKELSWGAKGKGDMLQAREYKLILDTCPGLQSLNKYVIGFLVTQNKLGLENHTYTHTGAFIYRN